MSIKILKPETILKNRYKIQKLINTGGMASVYKALDIEKDNAICAVKEMLPNAEISPDNKDYLIKRFKTEAEILQRVRHTNLPIVTDYFIDNENYYLVMDYIEGQDLKDIIDLYPEGIPESLVAKWTGQLLDALDFLHNQDPPIVYRDLKPENIMVKNSGQEIVLIDFGLARPVNPKIHKVMTVVGTPAYAPEELYHGKPEPRSDLYSLAATMHNLLTGDLSTRPFSYKPLREIKPEISEELEAVVIKALERDAENRFKNAREMKEALDKIYSKAQDEGKFKKIISKVKNFFNKYKK